MDDISFSSCKMTAWAGNKYNNDCSYVCAAVQQYLCVCVQGRQWIADWCLFWQRRSWLQQTTKTVIRRKQPIVPGSDRERTGRSLWSERGQAGSKAWQCCVQVRVCLNEETVPWQRQAQHRMVQDGAHPGGTGAKVVLSFPGTRQTKIHTTIHSHKETWKCHWANTHWCLLNDKCNNRYNNWWYSGCEACLRHLGLLKRGSKDTATTGCFLSKWNFHRSTTVWCWSVMVAQGCNQTNLDWLWVPILHVEPYVGQGSMFVPAALFKAHLCICVQHHCKWPGE